MGIPFGECLSRADGWTCSPLLGSKPGSWVPAADQVFIPSCTCVCGILWIGEVGMVQWDLFSRAATEISPPLPRYPAAPGVQLASSFLPQGEQ